MRKLLAAFVILQTVSVVLADGSETHPAHVVYFDQNSFRKHLDGIKNPAERVGQYSRTGHGVRIVLETPGTWRGFASVGHVANSMPQFQLYGGDRISVCFQKSGGKKGSLSFTVQLHGGKLLQGGSISENGDWQQCEFAVPEGTKPQLASLWVMVQNQGPGGAEFVVRELVVSRKRINTRVDADQILQTPPSVKCELKESNGVMSIHVDGKPITGLGWGPIINHYQSDQTIENMIGKTGFPVARVIVPIGYSPLKYFPPSWLGPDHFDWSYMDQQVSRILKASPKAKVILQVALDGAPWWVKMNPESAGASANMMTPDYLSSQWRKDSRDAIRQMIAHIRTSSYKDAVIGYQLFNGSTLDCNFEVNTSTPAAVKRFQDFLRKRYKSLRSLRAAWQDGKVTFENATPLRFKKMPDLKYQLVFAPATNMRMADSRDFRDYVYSQVIINFCQDVKEATHNRAITGARTGHFFYGAWNEGHLGGFRIKRLIESPYLDCLEVWEPYPGRGLGYTGGGAAEVPPRAMAKMKKLFVLQNDVRTHTGPDRGYGATKSLAESINKQRRVLLNAMMRGATPYLFQLSFRFDDPGLLEEWRLQQDIFTHALKVDRSSNADLVYVFDIDYPKYLGFENEKSCPTRGFSLLEYPRYLWARAGVPYDTVFLHQLEKERPYKVYVFFHTIAISEKQRQKIHAILKKNKAVGIFVWADGFIDGNGNYSDENMTKLTGMKIRAVSMSNHWRIRPADWFCREMNIPKETALGTLVHNEPCEPLAPMNKYSPSFFISGGAKPIGLLDKSNQVAIATKQMDGWQSIYTASPNVVPILVRYALKQAGVSQYIETDDLFYCNNSFVGLHTKIDGVIKLTMPDHSPLYDVYSGRELKAANVFSIPVKKFHTYLFYRGSAADWKRLAPTGHREK